MKKNLLYGAMILCMGLLLASCGKDDDPKTNALTGTWKVKEKNKTRFQVLRNYEIISY